MAKFKVTVKPVEGEPLIVKKFDTIEEVGSFKTNVLSDDGILLSTPYQSLVVITESLFMDEWVETARDYMMR